MPGNDAPAKSTTRAPCLDDIPELIECMCNEKGEKSAAATKRVYELCDVGHKQNRVPMVCSGKWDVLTPLAKCLTQESGDGRHLACLALNNLSIPTENKRVMALGPAAKEVIGGLCKVIAEDKQESYLCCICLMNLSFLEASITSILKHSPSSDGSVIPPLSNPDSLIRVLEKLLANCPTVSKSGSGKSEGVRWACGLIKNLAKSEENAILFGKTDICKCVVDNLRNNSMTPPSRWTSNSLEDFSLFVVLNLAQWNGSKEALLDAETVKVIKPMMSEGDLQGLKATMACAFLDAEWREFPDGGQQASKTVADLMTNIVEKKGKDGQYAYGVFKLYTATKAFCSLARCANESSDGKEANTKTLATPSSVALCLQVVSDLVLSASEDSEGGSKYVPDPNSAEYCCLAIEHMLPAILAKAEQETKSQNTDKAVSEISNMFNSYKDVQGTSQKARKSAENASNLIKAANGTARPILEISYDLWLQYRKREGQPLDQFISRDAGVEVDETGPLDFLPCVGGNDGEGSCAIA
mmetsp:Transcript_26225/g.30937  ORF Transcript_26225/g.30937 Transcript_26225/m.30937 type:complete len:526 (+) Transcript_26225:138-1715(+)|eukprot:CAMPEP_0198261998 /NCGR_PEP_ID=MMETSP1447-20131203/10571_1 /TAXON_ID=420782 /ORGANISM="Chaetoceros dichaeta, Strain CCMP1751" /LENGTH=525 /DNA_ID=CAMNT_0043950063 /DNA_START=98 /DNA_END=1675 /DNA_ORIENTATION=-